jgi:hypothetical protein
MGAPYRDVNLYFWMLGIYLYDAGNYIVRIPNRTQYN